jgi:uncharacterized protein
LSDATKSGHCFDVGFAKDVLLQVKQYLVAKDRRLRIIWHGGEPLLWGVKNYREVFAFMRNEFGDIDFQNSIQTNLVLLDDAFIDLFLEYNVRVGFSLDGVKDIHDVQRVDSRNEGTFDRIMERYHHCVERGLKVGCIVVATRKHLGRIPELYRFMCDNGISFKLNPIFSAGEAKNNFDDYGLTNDEFARMSNELFDLWFYDDEHKTINSNFTEIASNIITRRPSGCMFGKNCQENFLAVSPNGDVFPCGRFCDKSLSDYSYGNLHEEGLDTILPKIKLSGAYNRFRYIEESSCRRCRYFDICHGGCLHDGFIGNEDFKTKTVFCGAYKKIFAHVEKRLAELRVKS